MNGKLPGLLFQSQEPLKWKYYPHTTHFFPVNQISRPAAPFSISSFASVSSVRVRFVCSLFKPGLRCFSHIFAAISSDAISTPDLFSVAGKNGILCLWYCLLSSVPQQQPFSYSCVTVQRVCGWRLCVSPPVMRLKKNTANTFFTTSVLFSYLSILCVSLCVFLHL